MTSVKFVLVVLSVFICIACNDGVDKKNLYGKWKTVEWKELQSNRAIPNNMNFDFSEDGKYVLDYGSEKEIGKWWVRGDFLHTREDGQQEKKVKITSLSRDTMIFQMNRGGILEQVILLPE